MKLRLKKLDIWAQSLKIDSKYLVFCMFFTSFFTVFSNMIKNHDIANNPHLSCKINLNCYRKRSTFFNIQISSNRNRMQLPFTRNFA